MKISDIQRGSSTVVHVKPVGADDFGALGPLDEVERAHSRFPGHALTPTGVMAIRCKQFHLPDL